MKRYIKSAYMSNEYGDVEHLMIQYDEDQDEFRAFGDTFVIKGDTLEELCKNVGTQTEADEIIDRIDWSKKDIRDEFEDYGEIVVIWN